jgi:hypothetical protein
MLALNFALAFALSGRGPDPSVARRQVGSSIELLVMDFASDKLLWFFDIQNGSQESQDKK